MGQIYCTNCGTRIDDSVKFCPNCGTPIASSESSLQTSPQVQGQPQMVATGYNTSNANFDRPCPETHLTKAILLTIFCCWPLGIPAIVNASGVSNAFLVGNYALAEEKSKNAEKWCNYSIIGGVVFGLYILLL